MRSRSAANARKSRHYNLKKYSKTDTISIVSKYSLIIGRRSAPVRTKERTEAARGACYVLAAFSMGARSAGGLVLQHGAGTPAQADRSRLRLRSRHFPACCNFLWRRSGREGRARRPPRRGSSRARCRRRESKPHPRKGAGAKTDFR